MKYIHTALYMVGVAFIITAPVFSVHAQSPQDVAQKTSETTQKITTQVRDTALPWYQKIDGWRARQNESWKALKKEKELQIKSQEQLLDENRDGRVDNVLNEEQVSIVTGSGEDINVVTETFLLKLYVSLLSVFVIIFSYPVVFYAIVIFVIISIISSIINKVRNPHAF